MTTIARDKNGQPILDDNGRQIKIPMFRTTSRLIRWIEKHGWNERLDEEREKVFFKPSKKEDPSAIAHNVAMYANMVGKLPVEFERLLAHSAQATYTYCTHLHSHRGEELSTEVVDYMKGHSVLLVRWAHCIESRLPKHLEDSIQDPGQCLKYAKEILKGRLPSHLESVFFKDIYYATKYAFEVIRGFAPVKLPDDLHAFVVMKSFEHPNDENIKIYMEASESSPDKLGNSTEEV